MSIGIKVETQEIEGSRNLLSQEEIDNSKGLILVIDRIVEPNRFTKHQNVLEASSRTTMKNLKKKYNLFLIKKMAHQDVIFFILNL